MTTSNQVSPPAPTEYSFIRYLTAKKTVDDRALNAHVWQALVNALPTPTAERPLQVLEVGAGIGTMVERLAEQQVLAHAHYTALDKDPALIAEMRRRLPARLRHGQSDIVLKPSTGDALSFATRADNQQAWDLLIAHAFLDLVHMPTAVPRLLSYLWPGGLFYFTIVFDGATILQPELDPAFDAEVERLYHLTMDRRLNNGQRSGDSQSGRRLLSHLQESGATLLAAGSSDWVVFGGRAGYPADEAYFLRYIIHTIQAALCRHPDLDPERFAHWIAERYVQIERGELIYITHQLDVVGQKCV